MTESKEVHFFLNPDPIQKAALGFLFSGAEKAIALARSSKHEVDEPSARDYIPGQPTVLIRSQDGYFVEVLMSHSASNALHKKNIGSQEKATIHLKQESKSNAALKQRTPSQKAPPIQQREALGPLDGECPKKVNVVLESKKGTRITGTHICEECGTPTQNGFRYGRSNLGSVVLCTRCKPTVFNRSHGNIDALDYALTGGRFEGNRSKH